jgi:hypothetical protein
MIDGFEEALSREGQAWWREALASDTARWRGDVGLDTVPAWAYVRVA